MTQMQITPKPENDAGLNKNTIIDMLLDGNVRPGLNMALIIASTSLANKTTWTGTDYAEHWLFVGDVGNDAISEEEKCVRILHDVVEDSDWEPEDFELLGYSHRVVSGIKAVTKNKGEKYLDAAKRCSFDPYGRRSKKRDNKHNMDLTRSFRAANDKQKYLYHICYTYLDAVDNSEIPPGLEIWKFLAMPKYKGLVTRENIRVIVNATDEVVPQAIAQAHGIENAAAFSQAGKAQQQGPHQQGDTSVAKAVRAKRGTVPSPKVKS